ncbi:MAG: CYTH domain-containing protein [Lachnospiraceae bacterium]|nr:CYTH domain-containing protein [Lachnospiraceae bacterium]
MKNIEIEKKYLVKISDVPFNLNGYKCLKIAQGFISLKPALRIRKVNDKYFFAIKSKPPKSMNDKNDLVRTEYEFPIDKQTFNHLEKLCIGRFIIKDRYIIPYKNGNKKYNIELDIFKNDYKGLVYAEVEFNSVKDASTFKPPSWFYKDVTGIEKYKNTSLSICKNIKSLLKY